MISITRDQYFVFSFFAAVSHSLGIQLRQIHCPIIWSKLMSKQSNRSLKLDEEKIANGAAAQQ